MKVLQEILEWSVERPVWQRNALRRLVVNGELSNEDLDALTEICKSAHGLSDQQLEATPLSQEDIPSKTESTVPVSLVSIFHHRGVNALAEDQRLKFSPGLTLVYGDNGAGKTGYIRILKSACRARGQETILGNVVSGTMPLAPVIAIKYKVGNESEPLEWASGSDDGFVSRVSVFDSQCAAVYLTEKTDVAFRPFGLDVFDNLVKSCKSVRSRLESQQRALSVNTLAALQTTVPADTAVAKFLAALSSLTKKDAVQALARLSLDEEKRLTLLEKSLLDLQASDPKKLIHQLNLRAGRIQTMATHLKEVDAALSDEAVKAVFDVRTEHRRKSEEAKRLREATFPVGSLAGTGTESWTALWEAARRFSYEQAYRDQPFPVVEDGAHCVLCQQNLDHTAAHRLKQFEAFVASKTETELRQVREHFARLKKDFAELRLSTEVVDDTLKEIHIDHEAVGDAITAALASNEGRRIAALAALSNAEDDTVDLPALASVTKTVETLAEQVEARIKNLRTSATDETRKRMTAEVQELHARKLLGEHEQIVLDDIERRKKYAAYGLCIDDTRTKAITQKSTAVTKVAVSQKLQQSFQNELATLSFRHVEVELSEVGGAEGVLYHKLILTRAPGVELLKVVSEGEQRCLSIAAFFAELSTADDPSGIVFDDPISSLDYQWRQGVARRLVQESKIRQVVVFTHDVVFLLLLRQFAEQLGIEPLDQHIRHLATGAGVCAEELPWVALPVKKKIGYLNTAWQAADKLSRDGNQDAYEREAKDLYGLLREAWERAIEEVLLGGVVERFRPGVQTQQIQKIADITADDCQTVEVAMTKCSQWLRGHDQAPAARAPVPDAQELKADIEALDNWVTAIRKRRR